MSTDLFGVRVLALDPARRRVRFRVFVVYYEPSWGTGELLPDDPSFYFRLLWEAAENFTPHRYGPLTDLVTLDEFLDEQWVDENTHRFVTGVERVAERNHPLDDDDFDRLAMFYYERDGRWKDEDQLAQGDYDVHVTDARWIESLHVGQSWGTTSYSTHARLQPSDGATPVPDVASPAAVLDPFPGDRQVSRPDLLFSDDSRYLAVTSSDGGLVVYRTQDWSEHIRLEQAEVGLVWAPGTHVLQEHDSFDRAPRPAWSYDVDTGAPAGLPLAPGRLRSPGGRYWVQCGEDNCVTFLDGAPSTSPAAGPNAPCPREGRKVRLGGRDETISDVAFTADDALMFAVGREVVHLVDPDTGEVRDTLQGPNDGTVIAVSPDGSRVATTSKAGTSWDAPEELCIRRTADKRLLCRQPLGDVLVAFGGLAWSADGRWLVANLVDRWDGNGGALHVFPVAPPVDHIEERYAEQAEGGSMTARFVLGWLRQDRGDTAGAAEAYRQVADGPDRQLRGKALLHLGDLQAARGDHETACDTYGQAERSKKDERYNYRYRSRAALRRGVLLRQLGRQEEARAAFARARAWGGEDHDHGVEADIRHLTKAASGAGPEAAVTGLDGPAPLIGEHREEEYDEAVAELARQLFAEGCVPAEAALAALGAETDTRVRDAAADFLVELAAVRPGDEAEAAEVWEKVRRLVASGSGGTTGKHLPAGRQADARTVADARKAARQLLRKTVGDGEAAVVALATAAEPAHPTAASSGFRLAGMVAELRHDGTAAAHWFERGAAVADADDDTRAHSFFSLGLALRALGATARAQEAFAQAEAGFEDADDIVRAAGELAGSAYAEHHRAAKEFAAQAREAVERAVRENGTTDAAGAIRTLQALLTEVGAGDAARAVDEAAQQTGDRKLQQLLRRPASAPGGGRQLSAAYHYGHRLHAHGRLTQAEGDVELAVALLKKVAGGTGSPYAAGAAVTVGAVAHSEGDSAAARQWWQLALAEGDKEMSHKAVTHLGALAKQERNLPELLEYYGQTAESDHDDAPLFAARIGELCHELEQWDEALHWYRRTLDSGTDDPELVGEAGYRVGGILHRRGESEAAVRPLGRAAATGFEPFARQAQDLLAGLD